MAARVVFLGDDFTGASDSLARYAQAGWRSRLLIETGHAADDLDALGIATDLRSRPPEEVGAEIARLWPLIAAQDPQIVHLKICSTFDSSPRIGSIGAMVAALRQHFQPEVTAIIGGQPSLGRYLAFGHLFARGPDGEIHRIDRHPVMARHPVTPMREADMRLHLAAQGLQSLDLVTTDMLADADAVAVRLRAGAVVFDILRQQDLERVAEALRRAGGRQLLVGASSVAEMLTGAGHQQRAAAETPVPRHGGALIFAGSRSPLTEVQVAGFRDGPVMRAGPADLASESFVEGCAGQLRKGQPVLVALDPEADYAMSPDALADRSVALLARILAQVSLGYLGIAGGDTSSRICAGLGFHALEFDHQISPGVSVCIGRHRDPGRDRMRLMLKGGQMGDPALFGRFVDWAGRR